MRINIPLRPRCRVLFFVLMVQAAVRVAESYAATERLDASQILRLAENVRSPALDYAADFSIQVIAPHTSGQDRLLLYSMIAHGKDHALILMRTPSAFYGGTLLASEGSYWLLLPRASKPLQLSPQQILGGDVAYGDLARSDLAAEYSSRLEGSEELGGEPCWRLELTPSRNLARYSRIRCWIAKKGFRPKKFEYFGFTGSILRVARYMDYRDGPLGFRPMRIEVENSTGMNEKSILVFSDLRKIDVSPLAFTREGIVAFRDAALLRRDASGEQPRLEDLLVTLAAGKP